MLNHTTTIATPFTTPTKNTIPAFGVGPAQQNVTFGATSTPAFGSSFDITKPQFGSPITPSSGRPGMTITQTRHTSGGGMIQPVSLVQPQPEPAFGGLISGKNPPTTLTFGTTAIAARASLSFDRTPAISRTNLSFGSAPPVSQTGLSFGSAPAASQTGLSFGSAPPVSQTGLSFGSAPAASQTVLSPGFTPATSQSGQPYDLSMAPRNNVNAPETSVAFSTPTNTAVTLQSNVTFGIPTSTMVAAPQAGSSSSIQIMSIRTAFGMPAATTTQSGASFGMPSSTSAIDLSGAPTLGAAAAVAMSGLTFGAATTSSTVQSTLNFGTVSSSSTTATTSAHSTFNNVTCGSTAPTSTIRSSFSNLKSAIAFGATILWQKSASDGSATIPFSRTSTGLGGVDHSAVATVQCYVDTVASVTEHPLPNEIQQTVLAFKERVKVQRGISSEVARSSTEQLTKLTQQITAMNNLILNLGSVLRQQKFAAEKMKSETIKSLNDYELIEKIKDSPVVSDERLLSIRQYFAEKISDFEASAKVLQEKIEYVYRHVSTLPQENGLSAEALKRIVKKLHDSFVVIGAHTYKLHNDVQLLKVQYMTFRNRYIKDDSSISFSRHREFELPLQTRAKSSTTLSSLEGPNPFSRSGYGSFNSLLVTSQNRRLAAASASKAGLPNTLQPSSDACGVSSLFNQSTSSELQLDLGISP